jgi:hypothetical protein
VILSSHLLIDNARQFEQGHLLDLFEIDLVLHLEQGLVQEKVAEVVELLSVEHVEEVDKHVLLWAGLQGAH